MLPQHPQAIDWEKNQQMVSNCFADDQAAQAFIYLIT